MRLRICFLLVGLVMGSAGTAELLNRAFAADLAKAAETPAAVLTFQSCGKYLGAVIITGDGRIHAAPEGLPPGALAALAKTLPKQHSGTVVVPCDETPRQST